jgi:hypothetical protein
LAISTLVGLLRLSFDGAIIDSIAMRARETRLITGESAFSYDLASATHPFDQTPRSRPELRTPASA